VIREILLYDEPILRQKAKKVKRVDASIERLVDDMIETMRAANGVGLAAPQVGVPLRVVVIEVPDQDVIVLVNPEVVKASGERLIEEGCLSVPGYVGEIKRHVTVVVKARDLRGKEIRVKGTALLAQALEHETEHLDGVLFFDHLESMDQLRRIETRKEAEETEEAEVEVTPAQ